MYPYVKSYSFDKDSKLKTLHSRPPNMAPCPLEPQNPKAEKRFPNMWPLKIVHDFKILGAMYKVI